MIIGNPSSASIAASVWAFTGGRQLSSLAALATAIGGNPSIGAGVVQDLRPVAGKYREMIVYNVNSGNQLVIGTYDGVTFTAFGGTITIPLYCNSMAALGSSMKNNSAGALNSLFNGYEMS